jgi:putative isomerase
MNESKKQLYDQYRLMQKKLATGWNTWNTRSVLSHVLLPYGLNVQLCINNTFISGNHYLRDAYISSKEQRPEKITPGYHAYDGSYTELKVEFEGTVFKVETATQDDEWVMLVTPEKLPWKHPHLVLEVGMLWNRKGEVQFDGNLIQANVDGKYITIGTTSAVLEDFIPVACPYLSVELEANKAVGFYAGEVNSLEQIENLMAAKRKAHEAVVMAYGELANTFDALHSVIAWNIIYDPFNDRVIFPVSRLWNEFFGGPYVLFDWDTYFGAYMVSLTSKELAYANAVEITKHITPEGFIPNYVGGYGLGSHDRSQPPVGSRIFRELYKRFGETWILEFVFDELLTWNRWWHKKRNTNGFLCWGSDPLPEPNNGDCNNWQAAAYETGLDNSPMYDDVPFNNESHKMELADVGLMGMYIMDCNTLADIALVIGKNEEAKELQLRAIDYREALKSLWSEKDGIFLNKRTDTGAFSKRLSPTLFYALLGKVASDIEARRMVDEHLLNPNEFFGEWMLPSIAKNDPAYNEQGYWRGRIWAPMNFLVYLSLKEYPFSDAIQLVVKKSLDLLMHTWQKNKMVHENYNGITGNGRNDDERINLSDSYYHWGALLGFMSLIEHGFVPDPTAAVESINNF